MKNWSLIVLAITLFACKAKEKTQKTVENTATVIQDGKYVKYQANNEDWTFKIFTDNTIEFTRAEEVLVENMEIGSRDGAADGGEQSFFTLGNEEILQFTIRYEECMDDQSGLTFDRTVHIEMNGESLRACLKSGDVPFNVNQKWNLTKLAGVENSQLNQMGEKPFIILNQEKGYINGSTGCNSLNGSFKMKEKQVSFSSIATTKVGCRMMDVEIAFINAIQETNKLERMDQQLVFYKQSEVLMEFSLSENE